MSEIKYEIIKNIGMLSKPALSRVEGSESGWAKEVNLISWNDREAKYDIREWSADHSKMGKGVTLSKAELMALKELLNSIDL
ncbi:MAG: PC4/YdbC family ssDNA-binding protein [Anaerolineales bacterium]|nr:PC4/YdbC family ssDNA-binding protein [Anaerolineales bacterium]